jgi:hypothetical protein
MTLSIGLPNLDAFLGVYLKRASIGFYCLNLFYFINTKKVYLSRKLKHVMKVTKFKILTDQAIKFVRGKKAQICALYKSCTVPFFASGECTVSRKIDNHSGNFKYYFAALDFMSILSSLIRKETRSILTRKTTINIIYS